MEERRKNCLSVDIWLALDNLLVFMKLRTDHNNSGFKFHFDFTKKNVLIFLSCENYVQQQYNIMDFSNMIL